MYHNVIKKHVPYICLFATASASHSRNVKWHSRSSRKVLQLMGSKDSQIVKVMWCQISSLQINGHQIARTSTQHITNLRCHAAKQIQNRDRWPTNTLTANLALLSIEGRCCWHCDWPVARPSEIMWHVMSCQWQVI